MYIEASQRHDNIVSSESTLQTIHELWLYSTVITESTNFFFLTTFCIMNFIFRFLSLVGVISLPMATLPPLPQTFSGWQMRDCSSLSSTPPALSATPPGTSRKMSHAQYSARICLRSLKLLLWHNSFYVLNNTCNVCIMGDHKKNLAT